MQVNSTNTIFNSQNNVSEKILCNQLQSNYALGSKGTKRHTHSSVKVNHQTSYSFFFYHYHFLFFKDEAKSPAVQIFFSDFRKKTLLRRHKVLYIFDLPRSIIKLGLNEIKIKQKEYIEVLIYATVDLESAKLKPIKLTFLCYVLVQANKKILVIFKPPM